MIEKQRKVIEELNRKVSIEERERKNVGRKLEIPLEERRSEIKGSGSVEEFGVKNQAGIIRVDHSRRMVRNVLLTYRTS